jgi:hypothetical protein
MLYPFELRALNDLIIYAPLSPNCHQSFWLHSPGRLATFFGGKVFATTFCIPSTTPAGLTMQYLRNTLAVLWPLIIIATSSPALTKLHTADLHRSWTMSPS